MRFRLALIPFLAMSSACADFKRGEYWGLDELASTSGGEGEYSYAADIHPLLDAGCERCHAPGNSAEHTDFLILTDDLAASYTSTLEFVDLDNPAASQLLGKMAGSAHGGGVIYDDRTPEYDLTLAWIEQGAPP
jgi:hypothetical protein